MNAMQRLRERYGAGEARAIYELIVRRRFGLSRTDLLLGKDTAFSPKDKAELQIIVERVAEGEPVQYVLGSEEFCGREFLVGPGVLIPRPETQQLVHLVARNVPSGSRVLDIGTGSGCIAITLALAGYRLTALDVSDEALAYARRNAARLGADVEFVKGSIIPPTSHLSPLTSHPSPLASHLSTFNSLVSNPPYVCESEAASMDDNVLLHEPHLALFVPDDDPLLFYRAIAAFGLRHLEGGGWLFFEVNRAMSGRVSELLSSEGYTDITTENDEYGNERFVYARRSPLQPQ